jgi:WD40 repeat protein
VDTGVAVAQQQPLLVDEGIQPSPLFSEPAFQQQQQQQVVPGAATALARRVDPLLSCSAVLGLDVSRCGVLWLKQAGLLAYTASNALILLDLATKQQSLLSHHQQCIASVAVSTDGQLVATGSAGPEQAGGYADVAVWDVQQQRLLTLLQQHPVCVEQLAFSPDGAWLASVGSGRVVVWQVATGRATAVGGVKQVECCAGNTVLAVSLSVAARGADLALSEVA